MRIAMISHHPAPPDERTTTDLLRLLRGYASTGTQIEVAYPGDYEGSRVERELARDGRLNGLDHTMAAGSIIRTIVRAEAAGFDAVVGNNTFDPAIDAARLAVSIPVIGPLRASMHVALTLTDRIGLLVPLPAHVPHAWRLLRAMGLAAFVTDIQVMDGYGPDLHERSEAIRDAAAAAVEQLAQTTGAGGVIPLGGALIPNVVDPAELTARTGVPVFNTKAIAIRFAELCVHLGMTHSPLTYPPANLGPDAYESAPT